MKVSYHSVSKLFIFLVLICKCTISVAQTNSPDLALLAKKLDSKDFERGNDAVNAAYSMLMKFGKDRIFQLLDSLELQKTKRSDYFSVRFAWLKGSCIITKLVPADGYYVKKSSNFDSVHAVLKNLYSSAVDLAYKIGDEKLTGWVSYFYGSSMHRMDDTGLAVMYTKNGIDLQEKSNMKVGGGAYHFLSAMLYRVKEYEQCRVYSKKGTAYWKSADHKDSRYLTNCINTTALTFHRQQQYDSAFHYYNEALAVATDANDRIWVGIISGNIGQVFYQLGNYDTAYQLLRKDISISLDSGLYFNAGNSLQWAAKTSLALSKKERAFNELRQAIDLLKNWPDAEYLRNTYETATIIFRDKGSYDSAFYYNSLYKNLDDSLQKVVAANSLEIIKARLNDEASRYNIDSLHKRKQSEILTRNILIAAIILLSFVALLILNRKRLKIKMRMERTEQEKQMMEKEISSARQQMEMFKANIIDKTNLIEKLEEQVKDKQVSADHEVIMAELKQQTILTEEDWLRFKSLFEKIYPQFFLSLKDDFPGITLAEQRMASLIRLQLTTRQMSSMLGISPDSVHKAKQRLRHRLQLNSDANLDDILFGL